MKLSILAGSTSQTINVFIRDSSSTTGAGLSGLVYNTASLTAYYALPRAAPVAITLATLASATASYSSGGFFELDATHMKGWYRFDLPNTAISSGQFSNIHLYGATNMAPVPIEIELTAWNNQDGVHGGLSALPNTACTTNASLLTSGTGTAQLSTSSGQVLLQTGSGTGQLDFTSGVVKANVTQFGGSAGTFASGRPEVNTTHLAGTISAGTAGYTGIDWGHVTAATTTVALTGTTVGTVTTTTTATNLTNLPAVTTDWLTGTGVAASAVTKIQSGLATPTNITAGTITTTTNLTNAPTAGDLTTTMKASISGLTIARVTLVDTTTTNTDMRGTNSAALAATALSTAVWTNGLAAHIDADVSSVATTLAGAHGAGSWATATGFSTLDAPGVRTAVGLASANMDTQFSTVTAKTNLIPASPAAIGSAMTLDLTQAITNVKTATVGGALHGGWATAFGKMVQDTVAKTLSVFGIAGTPTPIEIHDLDDGTSPLVRTPR